MFIIQLRKPQDDHVAASQTSSKDDTWPLRPERLMIVVISTSIFSPCIDGHIVCVCVRLRAYVRVYVSALACLHICVVSIYAHFYKISVRRKVWTPKFSPAQISQYDLSVSFLYPKYYLWATNKISIMMFVSA